MSEISEFSIAYAIAKQAHAGQFRFDGVTPYLDHPIAVANLNKKHRVVAVLHDTLEDNKNITAQFLLDQGITKENVDAIVALTHSKEESYETYLERVKANPIARSVKISDICHNLSDTPSKRQVEKYLKAYAYLFAD